MPVSWNDKKVLERLFIAFLASLDNKIDVREVVRLYGEGMTYDALESHLRPWKKQATALKQEAGGREVPPRTPAKSRTKSANNSPSKGAVMSGRVNKKKPSTPSKVRLDALVDDHDFTMRTPGHKDDEDHGEGESV